MPHVHFAVPDYAPRSLEVRSGRRYGGTGVARIALNLKDLVFIFRAEGIYGVHVRGDLKAEITGGSECFRAKLRAAAMVD